MKMFRCGDVVPGCDVEFRHQTEDELLTAVAVHAHNAHGLSDLPPELVSRVRAAIVTA
jgi:predicted small metal-binding protein